MSTKTTAVKNYINDCGVKTQIFAFAGYDPNTISSNATQGAINLWNYSDFAVRVGKNGLCAVVPYVKWIAKRPYKPWKSGEPNTGNYYAYNDQNGYVYLCISNNSDNRSDIDVNVSNLRPSHTSGIQKYSDGYAWKPLYKITPSFQRFITANWLPVISFDTFDNSPSFTQLKNVESFCDTSAVGITGTCAIYAKLPLNTDTDSGTIEYQIGDLFTTAVNITCSDCYYLMNLNEKFKSVFYESGETIPNSIEILDNYSLVGSLIEQNQLSQSSPYYYLYDINQNDNLSEGAIISAFIDLSIFNISDLVTTVENPEFEIISNTGRNGRIRLKTRIYNNSNIISGIEVIEPGEYYKDIRLVMDSSIISIESSLLVSAISVNLDTIDGLGFDPMSILNTQNVMIDSRIEKPIIESSNINLPTSLNFFGMIENPLSEDTSSAEQWISGSNYNVKDDIIFRTTVQARVSNTTPGNLPDNGEEYEIGGDFAIPVSTSVLPATQQGPQITSSTTKDILIGGISPIGSTASKVEFKNLLYKKANFLVGATLEGSDTAAIKTDNLIESILAVPEFVQYSGKPVSTTKLNSELNISDTDSVIIRINMIKGM